MLSAAEVRQARRRRRPPPSLEQQYQEYILQRIESFKNSISRDELLRLGDEAVSELQAAAEDQFVLTEVLMLDSVDRLIRKRLALRPYRRWRQQFLRLRAAQREPTHWGIEESSPVCSLLPRLEADDCAVAIGPAAEPLVFLLAAHDVEMIFLGTDLASVDRVESRVASESLALQDAFVVQLGQWLPPFGRPVELIVLDPATLVDLPPAVRCSLIHQLQEQTRPGGVHLLLAAGGLAPEALLSMYEGWEREDHAAPRRRGRRHSMILSCPRAEPGAGEMFEDAG